MAADSSISGAEKPAGIFEASAAKLFSLNRFWLLHQTTSGISEGVMWRGQPFRILLGSIFLLLSWPACEAATVDGSHNISQRIQRGESFLTNLFDTRLQLLPEYRGSSTYWLFHDNYLAAHLLDTTRPDLSRQIRSTLQKFGFTKSGKIEIVFSEAVEPLPFRTYILTNVASVEGKTIRTELVTTNILSGWDEYADLLLLASLAQARSAEAEARREFERAVAMWDGQGFADRATKHSGVYATYKLALYLIAADRLNTSVPHASDVIARLLAMQSPEGGWWTDYRDGTPVGLANAETTCLSLLALQTLGKAHETTSASQPQLPEPSVGLKKFFEPPQKYRSDMGSFRSPLLFADGTPVRTPADWQRRRAEILATWHSAMGPWPPLIEKPRVEVVNTTRRDNITQQQVRIEIALGNELVDALLLVPNPEAPARKRPAVLVTYYDAETGVGLGAPMRDYGWQLAKRGFVTLSIGKPNAQIDLTAANKPRTDPYLGPVGKPVRVQPLSALAYAAANAHTVLARRPDVQPDRIGIIGHSFGGKWAMFTSCLYDKFSAAVWSDPGIVFDERDRRQQNPSGSVNYWDVWYLGFDLGAIADPQNAGPFRKLPIEGQPRTGAYKELVEAGHDLIELHALMAPRPFLVSGGTADLPERWPALNHAIAVNKLLGFDYRVALTAREGHTPTAEANEQVYRFFEWCLQPGSGANDPIPASGAEPVAIERPLRAFRNQNSFEDASGNPLILCGSQTWNTLQDWGTGGSVRPLDFDAFVSFLKTHGHNFTLLWCTELPKFSNLPVTATHPPDFTVSPHPWMRTGPGLATDGGLKFDLTKFDAGYFDRLRSRVSVLNHAGIYTGVYLFTAEWLLRFRSATDGYPLSGPNNVNGVDDGYRGGPVESGLDSVTMTATNVITDVQDAYVKKTIDTLNDLPNVLWIVSEEAPNKSTWWNSHLISLGKDYERGKPYQHPVGYAALESPPDAILYNSDADWVAPTAWVSPTTSCGTGKPACKVNINDSDHSYFGMWNDTPQKNRNYAWQNFLNGNQVLFMDPYLVHYPRENRNSCLSPVNGIGTKVDTRWENFRNNLGYLVRYSRKLNLANVTPRGSLSSTKYCLAQTPSAGAEYLVYAPAGGAFTVDLSAMSGSRKLAVEWFDPAVGLTVAESAIPAGSSSQVFNPPFSGDAVLYLVDTEGHK